MIDIRISQDYDNGRYSAEFVRHNSLTTICEAETEAEAIRGAKDYIESVGSKGDRVISVYGDIYTYSGNNWSKVKAN